MFQEIKYSGMRFPANLDTPYAVAQVLCQEPGKLRIKDLREGNQITTSADFPIHVVNCFRLRVFNCFQFTCSNVVHVCATN